MRNNRAYVVTPTKIENWDEDGAFFRIVFARSKEQAAAAYGNYDGYHYATEPEELGLDPANPNGPYVYRINIRAGELVNIRTPVPIIRFISAEPLLVPVNLEGLRDSTGLDTTWVDAINEMAHGAGNPYYHSLDLIIVGGETGTDARPMHADWVHSLHDQAMRNGIPFFFKQWGEYNEAGERVGRRRAGRLLDGREWNELPAVRVRRFRL